MRIFSTVFERKTHVAYAIIEMKKAKTAFKIVKKTAKTRKKRIGYEKMRQKRQLRKK